MLLWDLKKKKKKKTRTVVVFLDIDKPLCINAEVFIYPFCASCYQLHDTGLRIMVSLQSSRKAQRMLFVNLKLIHCHSTPVSSHKPPEPPSNYYPRL